MAETKQVILFIIEGTKQRSDYRRFDRVTECNNDKATSSTYYSKREKLSASKKKSAEIYQSIALQVAEEIARRNLETTNRQQQNLRLRKMVLEALSNGIKEQMKNDEKQHGFSPSVVI